MESDEIKSIRSAIQEKGLSWSSGVTSVSKLSLDQKMKRLGLFIKEEKMKLIQKEMADEGARIASQARASIYPSAWDWRNVSGKDWTTSIKNQGDCGACVAFATVGAIESNLEIFKRDSYLSPDLSEADLFFQGCGQCCDNGWDFTPALRYAKNNGIPDEACYPWDSTSGACPDRDKRLIKIEDWKTVSTESQAKEWISTRGPLISGMNVYEDFFYYRGGIYKVAAGAHIGDHAIVIVGYNNNDKCWICKNSWGAGWGENGWFRIAYGQSGVGQNFYFYAVSFSASDDILVSKSGWARARFKGKETAFDDEVRLYSPKDQSIFVATSKNLGKVFDLGSFSTGTRLAFALKTPDGHTYYTDASLNGDACDHVKKVQLGTNKWELRWEDLYGLGEQDYNDVVMEVEIIDRVNNHISVPKDGRVIATFKSKGTAFDDEFGLYKPSEKLIFKATDANLGKTFDLGTFKAGTSLTFALKTSQGYTYYTDNVLNPDSYAHLKKVQTGTNKWELRWEDGYELGDKDYNDVVVVIEVSPITDDDVVMPIDGKVSAKFYSKGTPFENEFILYRPESKSVFKASNQNLGKTFDVGTYAAGTRLVFGLKTPNGTTFYTDSSLNSDAKDHVFKLPLGDLKCQLRWEDLYGLTDRDYNDVVVEITIKPS